MTLGKDDSCMEIVVNKVDVFCMNNKGGNPAGVVLEADSLSDKQMQEIAKIVGLSETAFVNQTSKADFKVRFFTPSEEVDLCGHATIGTFHLLKEEGLIGIGTYTQETKAGILSVEVSKSGYILMEQNNPQYLNKVEKEKLALSLNISIEEMDKQLPAQIISTGLKDIIIPVKSIEVLNNIKPNFNMIKEISKEYEVVGYHVFTLGDNEVTAHCRNFAPLYEINEEAATGTSSGALCAYLYKYNKLKSNSVLFRQGYSMNKESEIKGYIKTSCNNITNIRIGGKSVKKSMMTISK